MTVFIVAAYYYGAVLTVYWSNLGRDVANSNSYAALVSIVRIRRMCSVAVM